MGLFDRIFGGGFETWEATVFQRYAPDPENVRDVRTMWTRAASR